MIQRQGLSSADYHAQFHDEQLAEFVSRVFEI
eukprot:COSAG06_NODE_31965_length_513_cov_1.113527_2_plen_31_part_01